MTTNAVTTAAGPILAIDLGKYKILLRDTLLREASRTPRGRFEVVKSLPSTSCAIGRNAKS
jgi:hypothetical protein